MDTNEMKKRTRVRVPGEIQGTAACRAQQPGTSVAKVALANGINANMLHTWWREGKGAEAPTVHTYRVRIGCQAVLRNGCRPCL